MINVNFEALCNVGIVNFETDTKKSETSLLHHRVGSSRSKCPALDSRLFLGMRASSANEPAFLFRVHRTCNASYRNRKKEEDNISRNLEFPPRTWTIQNSCEYFWFHLLFRRVIIAKV